MIRMRRRGAPRTTTVVPPHLAVVSVQVVHLLQPLAEAAVKALSGGQGNVWQLVRYSPSDGGNSGVKD
jgi:hypothetical protein